MLLPHGAVVGNLPGRRGGEYFLRLLRRIALRRRVHLDAGNPRGAIDRILAMLAGHGGELVAERPACVLVMWIGHYFPPLGFTGLACAMAFAFASAICFWFSRLALCFSAPSVISCACCWRC